MKIRNGFVSNSSSSSFIIGVAKVDNVSEAQTFLDSLKLNKYDVRITKIPDLEKVYDAHINGDTIIVESFNYVDVRVSGFKPEDHVIVMSICEGGESDFWNDELEECDYDIDLDFFSEKTQAIFSAICNGTNGIVAGQVAYGAGRDG